MNQNVMKKAQSIGVKVSSILADCTAYKTCHLISE